MRADYTHLSILFDRSGSMEEIREAAQESFNSFVRNQKSVPGKMTVSLAQFDDTYELLNDFVDIQDMPPYFLHPRNSTKLHDSTAYLINHTGARLAAMPDDERPAKVLIQIVTDGKENASQEYTGERVAEMIKHQEEKYNWQFVYLGTGHDVKAQSKGMGLKKSYNFNKSTAGTRSAFSTMDASMRSYRTSNESASFDMKQEDIDAATSN